MTTPIISVWHVPQVPMEAFKVEVDTITEAVKIQQVLADYDLFQYNNNIKGDYCNMNGINIRLDGKEPFDWSIETELPKEIAHLFEMVPGEVYYNDDAVDFLADLNKAGISEYEFMKHCPDAYDWLNQMDTED